MLLQALPCNVWHEQARASQGVSVKADHATMKLDVPIPPRAQSSGKVTWERDYHLLPLTSYTGPLPERQGVYTHAHTYTDTHIHTLTCMH